ncbi:MAG: hypothetical protein JWO08_2723 [Verrucomicrobiaceae bacterium]|nr:hypothetical protein [Verrucomicrobiaceae bacterium]
MKRLFIAAVLSSGVIASGAESRPAVDEVSQAAIQSAFQILRRDYIRREDLTLDQLNRAALHGLLERLSFGAELVKADGSARPPESRVITEALTPRIACLRPSALSDQEVAPMREALLKFKEQGINHLVLDLRSPAAPGDFETAASMLELFLPKGLLLFKLKQLGVGDAQPMLSRRDPAWTGNLVVLVDGETNNLGETVAAVLHQQKRALLVGSATRGATVRYETAPIESGWRLRFARAEVLLPDDSSVFRKGLKPDLAIALDTKIKHELFGGQKLKPTVFEEARPRFNEAALVSGKNPELDDYIRRSTGEVMNYDTPRPHDAVLQRAVDLLLTNDHFASSKLDWHHTASSPPADEPKAEPALPP